MNNDGNNITNINEYRENMMPDASAFNINNTPFECVEEFVSEEFVNAYLNATNQNTPDLWSRIEAGFEAEAREEIRQSNIRSARNKKLIGFVAAAALITIIAVPVMMLGMGGEKSEESIRLTESTTVAEDKMHFQESADSVSMDAPEDGAQEDAMEDAVIESATETATESGKLNTITSNGTAGNITATQLKEIEGVQTDDRQIVVVGEFSFDSNSNEVSFKIKEISDNQYGEFVIDIGDKINLSNSMYVLNMDVMLIEGRITLDSIEIDEAGNITGRIIDLEHLGIDVEK